jgi:hypothetical protein
LQRLFKNGFGKAFIKYYRIIESFPTGRSKKKLKMMLNSPTAGKEPAFPQ